MLSDYIGFVDFIINLGPGLLICSPFVFLALRIVSTIFLSIFITLMRKMFRNELSDRPCHESIVGM